MSKTQTKQSWLKFNPQDWRGDAKLRMCSIGARGLWTEMLCIMHEGEPYGHLVVAGRAPTEKQLAALAGIAPDECRELLIELDLAGVYSKTPEGIIFSRRMVRDKAKADSDRRNGKNGGNPTLVDGVNPHDNPPANPHPPNHDNGRDKAKSPESRVQNSDVAGDAREPNGSLISKLAFQLADELLVIAGHSLDFVPPGWCGAPMRVQSWLNSGWTRDQIVPAVKAVSARKRGPPANSVQFFENAIAEEVARQAAPVQIVEIREPKTLTVNGHGKTQPKSGSLIEAINRELTNLHAEEGSDPELPQGPILRISN